MRGISQCTLHISYPPYKYYLFSPVTLFLSLPPFRILRSRWGINKATTSFTITLPKSHRWSINLLIIKMRDCFHQLKKAYELYKYCRVHRLNLRLQIMCQNKVFLVHAYFPSLCKYLIFVTVHLKIIHACTDMYLFVCVCLCLFVCLCFCVCVCIL